MIKGTATIQFGSGSVASAAGVDEESGVGAVFMRSVAPGKIGRDPSDGKFDWESVMENAEVAVYFTNVESLDVQIHTLQQLREDMIKVKEGK